MSAVPSILKDIGKKLGDKYFTLLYTCTDEVDVEQFHIECDWKGPTVTILYGKNNVTFGGYTSQSWTSDSGITKRDDQAFLFYKTDSSRCVFVPIKAESADKAITCDARYGPTFGGGILRNYDLQAFKEDDKKEKNVFTENFLHLNGKINIGNAYKIYEDESSKGGKKKKGNTEVDTSSDVPGKSDMNATKLIVKQLEVYQVTDTKALEQWRTPLEVNETNKMKTRLENTEPLPDLGIKHYNILLIGERGSGKSSFLNTLETVFAGKVKTPAIARESPTSVTNKIYIHELKSNNGTSLNLRLYDIRGFEEGRSYDSELHLLLDGRLPVGYVFPDKPTLIKEDQLANPSLNNEIHLVCFVTGTPNWKPDTTLHNKLQEILKAINDRGLPMVVVATKFDKFCPKVLEDVNYLYKSPKAHEAVNALSKIFGIKQTHILPVVCYGNEEIVNSGKDMLALQALDVMVILTKDYLENHKGDQQPWKTHPTDEEVENIKTRLENLEPLPGLGIKQYNILLIGIIGSGKSSFYNTLATVLAGTVKSNAPARYSTISVTNKVHAYELKSKSGKPLNLRIIDIRGFEAERGYDFELEHLLNGRLPIGYTFPEASEPIHEDILVNGSLNDEIHLVCFVAGTSNTDTFTESLQTKIAEIQKTINMKGLPMVVIATKFDDLCPKIFEDPDNVYKSTKAQNAVKAISGFYGIKQNHIFPVVNYVNDEQVTLGKDKLALRALSVMVSLTEDYLEHHKDMEIKVDAWLGRAKKIHVPKNKNEKDDVIVALGEELKKFDEKELHVICIGEVFSGKSSFIDSLASALRDEIHSKAAGKKSKNPELESTTERMYQMKYKNKTGDLTGSKVHIGDTPGFQHTAGFQLEDAIRIIKGHVPNKYKIKGGIKEDCKKFKKDPKKTDRMHCVCFVFNIATSPDELPQKLQENYQKLQGWLFDKSIPYVVILTKGDLLCDSVKACKLNVFENKVIKERMDRLKDMFEFPQRRMFPVINYKHEEDVIPESDALLLAVFREILKLGMEYLDEDEDEDEDGGESDPSED